MKRRTFITAAGASIALLAGCAEEEREPDEEQTDTETVTRESTDAPVTTTALPSVTITDEQMEYDPAHDGGGYARLKGRVENRTDEEKPYIAVTVRFYDDDGVRIGKGGWGASGGVPPGEVIQFKTVPTHTPEEPARYEIDVESDYS